MQAPPPDADTGNFMFAQGGLGEGSRRDEASDGGEDDGCGPVLLTSRARARCLALAACDASASRRFSDGVLRRARPCLPGGTGRIASAACRRGPPRTKKKTSRSSNEVCAMGPARPCNWTAAVLVRPLFARGCHGESEIEINDNGLASILSTVHTALGGTDPFTGRSLDLQSDDSGRADVISMIHKVPLSGLFLWPVPFP